MRSSREEQARQHLFSHAEAADAAAESQPLRESNQLMDAEEKAAIAEWRQHFDFRADAEERFPGASIRDTRDTREPNTYIEWQNNLVKQREELLGAIKVMEAKTKDYRSVYLFVMKHNPILINFTVLAALSFLFYKFYTTWVYENFESRLGDICPRALTRFQNINYNTNKTWADCDDTVSTCVVATACHLFNNTKNMVVMKLLEPIANLSHIDFCKGIENSLKGNCNDVYYTFTNRGEFMTNIIVTILLSFLAAFVYLIFILSQILIKNSNRYASIDSFTRQLLAPVLQKHDIKLTWFINRSDVRDQLLSKVHEDSNVGYAINESLYNPRSRFHYLKQHVCSNILNMIFDMARGRTILPPKTSIRFNFFPKPLNKPTTTSTIEEPQHVTYPSK